MAWEPGDRLTHRFNPDLGPGLVQAVEDRTVVVRFPDAGDATLRLAADSDALLPLVLQPGARVRILATGEEAIVGGTVAEGRVRLADGRDFDDTALWPLEVRESPFEQLARGEIGPTAEFALRLDALHLSALREAGGLGSFLGGRIRLFPHQLYAAERATRSDPVRWLLADEVGLGKTVEACLILNHLLHARRADRTLVVAPETLTVQWLGELWRKYHQVFVLLDEQRLADVERDFGRGFNPFDAHRRVVVGMRFLEDRPWLTERAVEAGIDLLIVDEAHHLRRPPGHPGHAAYRAVAPIAALGRHVLLLTATPLEEDAHGYFRLVQLLRPEEFPEGQSFDRRLEQREPLPPCTSATRREDIGGLPPRVPVPVDFDDDAWRPLHALERHVAGATATNAVERRLKLDRLRRALASGAALDAVLSSGEIDLRALARRAGQLDPRLAWLTRSAPAWRSAGDKTLVFVAERESLEAIRGAMSERCQLRVGVFHEDLSPAQRDIEVAQFRLAGGPSMLVSTECGGEGRNFEFCTRLVLYDLPWNPMVVEQRIGRLDRIGRERPVSIVYLRPPSGLGAEIVRLYESLGLFRQPLGGLERELAGVEHAIEHFAIARADPASSLTFETIVSQARTAYARVQEAALHELHREPYRPEMAASILARVPQDLEELTREVVLAACEALNLHIEEHRGGSRHSVEFGSAALVGSLPRLPPQASFLGSFDRDVALEDESIDFFCTGHPLVEGILEHIEESPLGRTALLHVGGAGSEEQGFGLLALYPDGPGFEAVAVDADGRERPDWAHRLRRRPLRSRRVKPEDWTRASGWPALIRKLAAGLEHRGRPVAVAAFRIGR